MSVEQNKIIVWRFFDELWNDRNLAVADEIFAPDCLTHQIQSGAEKIVAVPRNAEAIKEHVSEWVKGLLDLRFSVEQMTAEADRVVTFCEMRGTHTGIWHGISATGKEISIRMTITHQIVNRKIVADWVLVESLGFFQQLGLLPTTQEIVSNVAK